MRSHAPLLPLPFLLLIPASCSPMDGMLPIPGGFPNDGRIEGAVQVRIAPDAFALVQRDPAAFLRHLFPDGVDVALPPQCEGSPRICCTEPDPLCGLQLDVTAASLVPAAPGSIHLSLRAALRSFSANGDNIPISFDVFGTPIHCAVSVQTDATGSSDVELSGTLQLDVHPQTLTAHVSLVDPQLWDLDSGDFVLSGDPLCGLADTLKPLFTGIISNELSRRVSGMLDGMLCVGCDPDAPVHPQCGPFATHCEEGLCMIGGTCLQRLGIEARAAQHATRPERLDAALDIYAVAGGYAAANGGGLSVGLLAGAEPADTLPHPCLPASASAERPELEPVAPSPTFSGAAPVAHHIAVGLHGTLLDHAVWAAWHAGQLCLDMPGSADEGLSADLLAALAPSVRDLAGHEPVAVRLSLRPRQPPALQLGPNVTRLGARGTPVLVEPLVTAYLDDLLLEVQGLVDDRYVRLLAMQADVTLRVGLHVGPAGRVTVALGGLEHAAENVRVTHSGLLAEDPEVLARTFSSLLPIAEPLIAGALPTVALPDLLGIPLVIERGGLTSSADGAFLAAYARLLGFDEDEPPANPQDAPGTLNQLADLIAPSHHHALPAVLALVVPLAGLLLMRRRRARSTWPAALVGAVAALATLGPLGCARTTDEGGRREAIPSEPTSGGSGAQQPSAVQPGQIGRYSDLTTAHGVVLVSAYEASLGDLVLGVVGGANGDPQDPVEVAWRVVDGLPEGAARDCTAGYRGGVRDAGPDVGRDTSVTARSDGAALIAYFDSTHASLRFAMAEDGTNETFATHTVDGPASGGAGAGRTASTAERVGLHASLALDAEGHPVIAYHATGVPGPDGAPGSELRVARARSDSPRGPDDWRTTAVDTSDVPESVGLWPSLAVTPDDALAVAYYARATGELKLATLDRAGWTVQTVDGSANVGAFASLAVQSTGRIHISYQDVTYGRLLYVTVTEGTPSLPEVVDDGTADDGSHVVGADSSLLLDDGRTFVVYQDQRHVSLRLATRSIDGTWTHRVLRGPPGGGFRARISAFRPRRARVSHFVYDRTDPLLGRLETFPLVTGP